MTRFYIPKYRYEYEAWLADHYRNTPKTKFKSMSLAQLRAIYISTRRKGRTQVIGEIPELATVYGVK